MGKTKIIIEMPTMLYLAIKLDGVWGYPRLTEAIRNGTPLPKGHGDLKDHNDIIKSLFDFTSGNKTLGQCIDDAPTIIEADKEG